MGVTDGAVGLLFTRERSLQLDANILSTSVAEFLELSDAERSHLLNLNAKLIPPADFRLKQKDESVGNHDLFACTSLGAFLEFKMDQQGLAQHAVADAVGWVQTAVSQVVTGIHKGKITADTSDKFVHVLKLSDNEKCYWNWLNDVRDKKYAALDSFKEKGNPLHLLIGSALIDNGLPVTIEAMRELVPLRQRPLLEAYLEIGFPEDVMRSIATKTHMSSAQLDVFKLANDAVTHHGKARIQKNKGEQKTLLEADDLCEALTIACSRSNTTFSSLAQIYGSMPDSFRAVTSYDSSASRLKIARGVTGQRFESILNRLNITDPDEVGYMKILNGCLWERYRGESFIWPEVAEGKSEAEGSNAAGVSGTTTPANQVSLKGGAHEAPDKRNRGV